ncbi:hypothetical protein T4A_2646 [Trichinella pseudospiralis]|uniref:Uncharacterized protein n=1 Tax=Trichinella pseudospiralis TaxID=6337 RepID=A0A0V1DQE6_TRIPS|nr:hypothetical protein T4A_2646 [Trichinella pseudospiralis]
MHFIAIANKRSSQRSFMTARRTAEVSYIDDE